MPNSDTYQRHSYRGRNLVSLIKKPGSTKNITIRAACRQCNNGWMSDLEERVKPIILSFNANASSIADEDCQNLLSRYFAMKFCVSDRSGFHEISFRPEVTSAIFLDQCLPQDITIWIYKLDDPGGDVHHYNKNLSKLKDGYGHTIDLIGNFTIRFGIMFVQAIICGKAHRDDQKRYESLKDSLHFSRRLLSQVHPIVRPEFNFGPGMISSNEALELQYLLGH